MLLVLCAADDFVAALRFPVDGSIVIRADPNVDVFSDTTDHTAVLPPTWRCCRRHRRHSTPGPRAELIRVDTHRTSAAGPRMTMPRRRPMGFGRLSQRLQLLGDRGHRLLGIAEQRGAVCVEQRVVDAWGRNDETCIPYTLSVYCILRVSPSTSRTSLHDQPLHSTGGDSR